MTERMRWAPVPRITLTDVAREAGVSRAIVSVVLRGQTGASEATRVRVLSAAEKLGYRPDLRAQSLAGNKSRLIGVMFGAAGSFHFDLLEGLYDEAERRNYSLILGALTKDRDEKRVVRSVQGFRLDGMILLGPASTSPLLAGTLPLAVIGWEVDHNMVDVVRTSDVTGMALAVNHLAELGRKRIAHLDGGSGLIAASRREAYQVAMAERGLARYIRVLPGGETPLDGARATQTMLRGRARLPEAIVSYNDDTAIGALTVLLDNGIRVPGDVAVTGYDNGIEASESPVGLTSVAQRPHELARLAVQRVVARATGRQAGARSIVLEPELVVRESTVGRRRRPRQTPPG
jgi:DNA-binding LacI/PurR family transcriptional regulator